MPMHEIVVCDGKVASPCERFARVAADVTGAAGHEHRRRTRRQRNLHLAGRDEKERYCRASCARYFRRLPAAMQAARAKT